MAPHRIPRLVALVALAPIALTACALGPTSAGVGFDDVQTATIQIEARGRFVEPGTLDQVEYGGRGSGFFIDDNGIAVTNNHVVVGAGTLTVWIGGDTGRSYDARVLGASECLDLAVIQVDVDGPTPYLDWYEGDIEVALDVYSAGFPLGDPNFTMTRGIVSKADVPSEDSFASLEHIIEHDARIRGGNSGGPLVADNGRVVGVNYAGIDELDYNYAIHRDQALTAIPQLQAGDPLLTLGINARAMWPAEDGSALGVWAKSVHAGGPADAAGIKPGDLVTSLGGITLSRSGTLEEYCQVITTQGTDAVIDVVVYRPSTDELLEGQLGGKELAVVASNVSGGGTQDPTVVGGFVQVTDDTRSVAVSVPDTWSQVDGAGFTDAGGAAWAQLSASPDLAGFQGTWGVPGVTVAATPQLVDPTQLLATLASGLEAQCTPGEAGAPYADGLYSGLFSSFSACGGTADYVVIAAQDDAGTHSIAVIIQLVSDFDKTSALEQILNTFQAAF